MAEDTTPKSLSPPGLRRVLTGEESAQFRRPSNRFAAVTDTPTPGVRRRSSTFSDYSLNEARKQFQSSTDDLLLPRSSPVGHDAHPEPSHWHSAPLAFALLPAIAGMLFKNGSSVVTDVMLLGLAGIILNWSVRLPWDWYHSAQELRQKDEADSEAAGGESGDENALDVSQASLDDVPENAPLPKPPKASTRSLGAHEAASKELYVHELLALLSCFLFPLFGAYVLHQIRSSLSRPSEGLVSNYNLTIFLLASELRPMSHLVKLVQARTFHLQRIVNSNPYAKPPVADMKDLVRRLNDLEGRNPSPSSETHMSETPLTNKQTALAASELRRTIQPDLDALNRAVRRYEKRATLQTMQTEARLLDLEARLADAISLAAAASVRQRSFVSLLGEWLATGMVLPLQAAAAMAALPFQMLGRVIDVGKVAMWGRRKGEVKKERGRTTGVHTRMNGDRVVGKGMKR